MLYQKREMSEYIRDFKKRFISFCQKAPLLLSFSITQNGVQVVNELLKDDTTRGSILIFDWDFTLSPKEFIYAIKQVLKRMWYPKLLRQEVTLSEGETEEALVKKTLYVLDKIILFNDLFILENSETGEKEFFKFTKNSYLFVKQLKEKADDAEALGLYFFQNAEKLEKEKKEDK